MIVSLNWLKEFVDIEDIDSDDLCEKMTMSGTKVEGIERLGENISNVVVGKIVSIEKHPDADKLVVTKIDVGNETLQIVTGADNIHEEDYVPVALVGSSLQDIKIKKSNLRGVESCGMLCSAEELGMNTSLLSKEDTVGIYIFKKAYPLGCDVRPLLGLDDQVIDFELTANRPDCMSVIGIAREVSATLNRHLILPIISVKENRNNIREHLKITIQDEDLCPRYVTRMLKVKKIEPSPQWMQQKLLNSGMRPINNIVDVTNYVMLEMGQPLHAFDYDKLITNHILVRRAQEGEKIITLDSVERNLDGNMLVITNGTIPVGIAGVMGGENSEIDNKTKMIVIESACFDKKATRYTGKKLGLRSEAENRFEKGVDPDLADLAADRAAQLLQELGAGEVFRGLIDIYPQQAKKKVISVDPEWMNAFIGINLSINQIIEYLERLFLTVKLEGEVLKVAIPTYRQDLEIKEDIAEEVARMYGYNNIPNTIIKGVATEGKRSERQQFIYSIKNLLSLQGFYEIITYSFTSKNKLEAIYYPLERNIVPLINPLGEENGIMRPTLIPGMLQVMSHNFNRNTHAGLFYEVAVTYKDNGALGSDLPTEEKKICLGMYGDKDFFHLKGYIQGILKKGRIKEKVNYIPDNNKMYHPYRCAAIIIGNEQIGSFGEIHPMVVDKFDLPTPSYICELNLERLMKYMNKDILYHELPKYPEINRDIALLVEDQITAKEIEDVIIKNGEKLLESVELFDVYRGKQVEKGYISMAYALTFRAQDRTLRDVEVNKIFEQIVLSLKRDVKAKLRE
ncbi:MAG: phenylalanine--tRNA ligase subunit beta [Eubacteriales bacterium]